MTTDTADFETELRDVFAEEARELLERIERSLVDLEQSAQSDGPEHLQRVRRALHTLKGAAGALEVEPITRICHALEDGLAVREEAGESLDPTDFDTIYRAVAFMFAWVDGEEDDDLDALLAEIHQTFDASFSPARSDDEDRRGDASDRDQPASDDTPESGPEAADPGSADHPDSPREPGPDRPSGPREARDDKDAPTPTTGSNAGESNEPNKSNKSDAPDDSPDSHLTHRSSTVRVASSKIDDLQAIASELVVLNLQQKEGKERIEKIRDELADVLSEWRSFYGELREVAEEIPSSEWRKLEHHASNLALGLKDAYQNSYDYARWSVGHIGQLDRVSENLEDGLRKIRMQPLGPFFDGFARVVRDAARTEDKRVRFDSRGRHIEVDRVVLERLREPLIHLVRNAVAHGIESPDRRQHHDKHPSGHVVLGASSVGENVELTVSDDGAGIDPDQIRRQAVEAGIVAGIEDATDRQLVDLLTHPGFSTRETTDEVAGRGIGLEAVEAVVTELGGQLELDSTPGEGTTFSLTIPTSITTSEGLVVQVGSYRLGIQLMAVERVIRIDPDELRRLDGNRIIHHDGDPVATVALADLVGVPGAAPDWSESKQPALILRHGNQKMAVVVDDLPGQMPMVVRPLGPQFDDVRHLAGGAIRADGSILPVVEHRALFRIASGRPHRPTPSTTRPSPDDRSDQPDSDGPATILVVDDSITTRTLERNILEAAGHRVVTAKDGAEALETLRDGGHRQRIDLVVTDLDMPRIGGLELCRTIRNSPEIELPVIVVTSKGDDDEIRRGLEAGADAYIVKGNFEQDHFMSTVNRFVD